MVTSERADVKVKLEGIEVKVHSVQISEKDGAPPTAAITVPASGLAVFVLPKTVCQIYVKVPATDDYLLIFEGELASSGMSRHESQRMVQHTFLGELVNWTDTALADISVSMQSMVNQLLLFNGGEPQGTSDKGYTVPDYASFSMANWESAKDKFGPPEDYEVPHELLYNCYKDYQASDGGNVKCAPADAVTLVQPVDKVGMSFYLSKNGKSTSSVKPFYITGRTVACNYYPAGTILTLEYNGYTARNVEVTDTGAFDIYGRMLDGTPALIAELINDPKIKESVNKIMSMDRIDPKTGLEPRYDVRNYYQFIGSLKDIKITNVELPTIHNKFPENNWTISMGGNIYMSKRKEYAAAAIKKDTATNAVDIKNKMFKVFTKLTNGVMAYCNSLSTFENSADWKATHAGPYQTAKDCFSEYDKLVSSLMALNPEGKPSSELPDDLNLAWDEKAKQSDIIEKFKTILAKEPTGDNIAELKQLATSVLTKETMSSLATLNSWGPFTYFARFLDIPGNESITIETALLDMLKETSKRVGGYYRMVVNALKLLDKVKIINNDTVRGQIKDFAVMEFLKGELNRTSEGSGITTIYAALMQVIGRLGYRISELAAPARIGDQGMSKIFLRPHSDFLMPCTSNIIFDDDVTNMSFSHSWNSEPTRTVTYVTPFSMGPVAGTDLGKIAFGVVMPSGENLSDAMKSDSYGIRPTAEEWLRGINMMQIPDNSELSSTFLKDFLKKEYASIKTTDVTQAQQEALNSESGTTEEKTKAYSDKFYKWLKANKTEYQKYIYALAQLRYNQTRQSQRVMSMNVRYSPYRVCGLPCMVIDEVFPGILGTLSSINTIFSADGTVTQSLGLSAIRMIHDTELTPIDTPLKSNEIRKTSSTMQIINEVDMSDQIDRLEPWYADFNSHSIYEKYYSYFGIPATNSKYYANGTKSMYDTLKKEYFTKSPIERRAFINTVTKRDLCTTSMVDNYYDTKGYTGEPSQRVSPYRADRQQRVSETLQKENGKINVESV